MRKFIFVFLLGSLTGCAQQNKSTYWPADQIQATTSGVNLPSSLTTQQAQNLNILCRVWGFVKYFHPTVAKGKVNVDKALFSILPVVLNATSKDSLDIVLYNWVDELGDVPSNTRETAMPNVFIEPGMQWLKKDSLIAGKLRPQLLAIFNNRHKGESYYVKKMGAGNPDFSNEFKYVHVKGEDGGMRLLALFRYWNTVEYFFPSKYLTADNWDEVLNKFIPQFASAVTDSAYRITCYKMAASIHDTHAGGIGYDSISSKYKGRYFMPVTVGDVEGSMTVLYHLSDSVKENSPLKPGDKIIRINGVEVEKLLDSIKPTISASNISSLKKYAMGKLITSRQAVNGLLIERGTEKIELQVVYVLPGIFKNARWNYTSIYPMYQKLSDSDIGYINLEKIKTDSLPEIFKQFENTKGLIIDIRNYPLAFMPFSLGKYLKPKPSAFVKFTRVDLQLPGRFVMTDPVENGENNRDYYKGKIVILVNESSISQSEYTAMALRSAPNAIVMGSQTSGADGNVSNVFLPGGLSSHISGLGVYYPDGRVTQGIGIVPDIEVKPTIKGIREGQDELLEAAIKYIQKK